MVLLPWGLHRILGIVTFLGIPPVLPVWVTVAGAVLSIIGLTLALSGGGARPPATPPTAQGRSARVSEL
jgi:hypothetical protein